MKVVIQSDNMKRYYDYAEKLIKKKKSYVCTCDPEEVRELLKSGKGCHCRKLDAKENLERWKGMLSGEFKSGGAVLRFKSDLKDKNPAMRDFPLARINETKHARQGTKYRVWPLMNLAVAVDDIEQEITHVIRGKDHRDNAERQKMIYSALGLEKKYPWVGFMGRLHFKDLVLSSSKIRAGIESGRYKGWGDIELPTAASLKKRGYKPEQFWGFVEHRGISEVDKVMSKEDFFKGLEGFKKG